MFIRCRQDLLSPVSCGHFISFQWGFSFEGIIQNKHMISLHPQLPIYTQRWGHRVHINDQRSHSGCSFCMFRTVCVRALIFLRQFVLFESKKKLSGFLIIIFINCLFFLSIFTWHHFFYSLWFLFLQTLCLSLVFYITLEAFSSRCSHFKPLVSW